MRSNTANLLAWARAFSALRMLNFEAIEEHVTALANSECWTCVAFALRRLLRRRERLSDDFVGEAAVWSLLVGRDDLAKGWVEPFEQDLFRFVSATQSYNKASLAVAAAFTQGWRTRRPLEGIREDAVNAYGPMHSRPGTIERVTLLCFGAAAVGRWLGLSEPPTVETARSLFSRLLEHARPLDLYRE